jgi:hypothetical protein
MSPIRKAIFFLGLIGAVVTIMLPPSVFADDCLEDPLNAADCMRTPGYRETITVIFSTLPTLSTVIPNLISGGGQPGTSTGETGEGEGQQQSTTQYVVQVSQQSLTLKPTEPQSLSIKAWKSVDGKPWAPAPEVSLAVSVAPDSPEVTVTPRSGAGEMHVNLSTTEEAQPGLRTLTIQGIAPKTRTSAQVQVDVQTSNYELRTSPDAFEILVGETKELEVSTWRRRDDGMMEEEPDARIRPWLPTERDFFSWSPPPPYTKGNNELYGRVIMKITALDARQDSELCFLDFTAIFPDDTEINKQVEITLKKAEYEVEFL